MAIKLLPYQGARLKNRRIRDGPGVGKSTRVRRDLVQLITSKVLKPKDITVIMFNVAARTEFKEHIQGTVARAVDVRTFHSLANFVYNAITGRTNSNQSLAVIRAIASRALDTANPEVVRQKFAKKLIVVDEAQDMTSTDAEIVRKLLAVLGCKIWLAGDSPQGINQFQGSDTVHFDTWQVDDENALDVSHRCTPQILEVVNALRVGMPMKSAKDAEGHKRAILFSGKLDGIKEEVLRLVSAALQAGRMVAVIGPVKKMTKTNIGLNAVELWFQECECPYKRHYSMGGDDGSGGGSGGGKRKQRDEQADTSVVHLHTIHSSKGLEFDVVLLMDFHEWAQGLISTAKDEEARRNLFHVGASRAMSELVLFHQSCTRVFSDIHKCWDKITVVGDVDEPAARSLDEECMYTNVCGWTEYLDKATVATEDVQLSLTDAWAIEWEELVPADPDPSSTSVLDPELAPVLALFAENTIEHAYDQRIPTCIRAVHHMTTHVVHLPSTLRLNELGRIWHEGDGLEKHHYMTRASTLVKKLDSKYATTQGVDDILTNLRALHPQALVHIHDPQVITQYYNEKELRRVFPKDRDRWDATLIWKACLFLYQYGSQAMVLWNEYRDMDVDSVLGAVDERLRHLASTLPPGMMFQKPVEWPRLGLRGVMDMVDEKRKRIIEFKFSQDSIRGQTRHALQVLGYREMHGRRRASEYTCEVWNLCNMERVRVKATGDGGKRWEVETIVAESLKRKLQSPIFAYDLETQGLLEDPESGIVEIYLEDMTTGTVPLNTLVFQDDVPDAARDVHGICAEDLVGQPTVAEVGERMIRFLERCKDPVLMAYNGQRYDDKIVRRDLLPPPAVTPEWADARQMIYHFQHRGLKHPMPKLGVVYEMIVGAEPVGAHRAACDTKMVIRVMEELGIDSSMIIGVRGEMEELES